MSWRVELENGIWLPDIEWRLDARAPAARSFVSHAHFDHMGEHETILCSRPTAKLIQTRLPGERRWITPEFGEVFEIAPETRARLLPAGHIMGSAMLWVERAGASLLYTGDFKLTPGAAAEPCQPIPADILVMETTYGLPRYVFPAESGVMAEIVRFCRETLENGDTPVLFGYSLGKCQVILRTLADSGLPVALHPQCVKITEACAALGCAFPPYRAFDDSDPFEGVVISPPLPKTASWLKRIRNPKTAIISGWSLDPSAVFRYQCDKAFPLSDHADYLDLQAFVAQVRPSCVYTVHGFAAEFAATLREQGIDAWALGKQNQLSLDIAEPEPAPPALPPVEPEAGPIAADAFLALALLAREIGATDSSNRKVELLAAHLANLMPDDAAEAALFLTGRPFPQCSPRKLNIGWSLSRDAVLRAAGSTEAEFKTLYRDIRDSVEVAGLLLSRVGARPQRSLRQMRALFDALAAAPNQSFRHSLLSEEFRRLAPEEAKLLLKIVSGDLRIGLKEGLVEEAIARCHGVEKERVRAANLRSGDIAAVARAAAAGTLDAVQMKVFHPLQFMLASPEPDGESIVRALGERVWVEDKYDGIRSQLHKVGERAELYSRDLNRVTQQFPEIAEAALTMPRDFILDGEALAWGDERPRPFADLQKRLGRKGEDLFLGEEIPVVFWAYDLLWLDGRSLLDEPLETRRRLLDTLSVNLKIRIAPTRAVSGAAGVEEAFASARARGHEGLVAKDPSSPYQPGRRGRAWIKLKKAHATIDAVVVAAEYGHGKRRDVLSDYTFAVRDEASGELKTIGKAYTGLTDVEIARLTERFLESVVADEGSLKRVRPEVVLEIAFDSIRRSARHASGLAMRFPRIKRIREDKTVADIDTVQQCERLLAAESEG